MVWNLEVLMRGGWKGLVLFHGWWTWVSSAGRRLSRDGCS